MSYKIDVSFKNCEEKDVYKKLEEFANIVNENKYVLLNQDFWYLSFTKLKEIYEETKNRWKVEDEIRKWISRALKFHFYYSRELKSLCVVYNGELDNKISDWFDGYVYFQNSCDQDYDYSCWQFNDKFKEYIKRVECASDEEFKSLYKELNNWDFDDEENPREIDDYDKRSLVYNLCYKDVEPLWDCCMKIQVGENIFGEYYDESKYVIRMLCGLEKFKGSDRDYLQDEFKYWRKIYNLESVAQEE